MSPAVTPANIESTICSYGYTDTVRPPESITEPEKGASLAAYGDTGPLHDLRVRPPGSARAWRGANDPGNLWPERGASPNTKDAVEDQLRQEVCDGRMTLARAQGAIAANWVLLAQPTTTKPPSGWGPSGQARTWHTDSSGYADVYFYAGRSAPASRSQSGWERPPA